MSTFISVDSGDQRINYPTGRWAKSEGSGSSSLFTSDLSAMVIFDFEGVMAKVVGNLNVTSVHQPLRYVLDGEEDRSFTLNSTFSSTRTLYSSPILTAGNHSLALTLMSNATALFVDGIFIITNPIPETKGKPNRTLAIVLGAIGGIVFILLLPMLFFYRRKRLNIGPYALGPLQVSLPTSKEAFTSRKYSHYGMSFTHSVPSSTDMLVPSSQNPQTHALAIGRVLRDRS